MISVIIPSLHSPVIDRVLAAVQQQTARHTISEIIVVGQDRHGLIAPARDLTFIATPQRMQQGAARNLGVRHATGDYLLFLDSDCIPRPDVVAQMLATHQQGYPVVGGAIALTDVPASGYAAYWMICDNALVFSAALDICPAGLRPSLPSHLISLHRSTFAALHGFLEEDGEDHDMSYRMRQQQIPMYFTPAAQVAHHHPRRTARAVWEHLRDFGRTTAKLWGWHPHLHRNPQQLRRYAPLIGGWGLPLALRDVLLIYARTPALRGQPHLLPGMVWGKWGWYVGVAERLQHYHPRPPAYPPEMPA